MLLPFWLLSMAPQSNVSTYLTAPGPEAALSGIGCGCLRSERHEDCTLVSVASGATAPEATGRLLCEASL